MSTISEIRSQTSEVRDVRPEIGDLPLRTRDLYAALCPLPSAIHIALLTGGGDKPYALGMAAALTSAGVSLDFIGSDDLQVAEVVENPRIRFLNLRGDQRSDASPFTKVQRVLKYYIKLISYAATAQPRLFHLLWNNKFELFDRT